MEPVADSKATRAKTEKKKVGDKPAAEANVKKTYVPPPPADGVKIPPPAGLPAVKSFPVSQGPPPAGMSFPGVQAAAPPEKKEAGGGDGGQEGQDAAPAEEEEVDDGFTPE